jgi:hypothetical protein
MVLGDPRGDALLQRLAVVTTPGADTMITLQNLSADVSGVGPEVVLVDTGGRAEGPATFLGNGSLAPPTGLQDG